MRNHENATDPSPEAARDPLAGRLGHLTPSQEAAFTILKQRVIEENVLVPGPLAHQIEYDDSTVIRYLRARRWNVDGALKQLKATADWMTTENIDTTYDEIEVEEFRAARRLGPRYTGARDRAGNPITVFRMDSLSDEDIKGFNKDHARSDLRTSIMTRVGVNFTGVSVIRLVSIADEELTLSGVMCASRQTGTCFYLPLLNELPRANPEVPIDSFTNIIDLSNMSLTKFWALRGYLHRSSTLATAHLPETLGILYIIGAPSIWSVVYGVAKKWFDEGTTSKFRVLSASEVFTGLSETIDPKSIPEAYGGKLKWHWDLNHGAPVVNQDVRELLGLGPDEVPPSGPLRYSASTGLQVVGKGRTEAELAYNGRGRRPAKERTAAPESNGASSNTSTTT
ncbi:BZ3500_MvSof-1268-A1-R1_Chr4-3g07333 [Microbotryum saponariae]|uniref:BZ3500_MvSof-1268-A1-R1_Chr4-3g07333 protein n=1 Tax=Microbotryum saponariae TaxID=289078 RepID=A0A2X0KYT0_9BASI|nr:BZ3500_MvSof-1268-A1-R1_Chr4-3g07333 [Microbotryum saponariae]SDA06996.1 BZ3501_MvSof-1269-A2-R1_Chr4-2g07042 [Microbotryum saponariae]